LGIVALGILRLKHEISIWLEVDSIFIVTYIIWIVLESKISKRDYNSVEKDTFDSGTCQIYALGERLTFLTTSNV
jgi:hypothetical protein